MSEEKTPWDLIQEIRSWFMEDIDFTRSDPDAIQHIVQRITAAAFYFNYYSVREFGGKLKLEHNLAFERGKGMVEQVVAATFQTFAGEEIHPHPFEKAAMLLRGITQGQPFSDGNKRTGFLLAWYFLDQFGLPAPEHLPVAEVIELCRQVSAGELRQIRIMAIELARCWKQTYP